MSTELPEPFAHPTVLETPTEASATLNPRRSPRRLALGLFIMGLGWVFANTVLTGVIIAAKLAILDPENKVATLGYTTALISVIATIALFAWGAVSDQIRSRFGRRSPLIALGAIGGAIGLCLVAVADTLPLFIAALIVYTVLFNALPPAVLAIFPDRVPRSKRGTLSAVYGGAQLIASSFATIVASRFITQPGPVLYASAIILFVFAAVFLVVAPDVSNKSQPRARLDIPGLLQAFKFPAGAPDFYWAFAGRFLLLLGLFMIQNFTLYILTDFIGLSNNGAGDVLALAGIAQLLTTAAGTFVAGPLSDKLGRRKLPIFIAALLFGIGIAFPLVFQTGWSMVAFSAVAGLGLGAFLSVDSALMTEVLPSEESMGKDLGILNTANTVPAMLAPLATSGIVALGLSYTPVFITSIVIICIGAVSIFKIKSVR